MSAGDFPNEPAPGLDVDRNFPAVVSLMRDHYTGWLIGFPSRDECASLRRVMVLTAIDQATPEGRRITVIRNLLTQHVGTLGVEPGPRMELAIKLIAMGVYLFNWPRVYRWLASPNFGEKPAGDGV